MQKLSNSEFICLMFMAVGTTMYYSIQ